ncbi:MAG: class I SAM-dependent DNA methyltransferase [Balneolaceae bacterium]|nr:class I SAM-dependent DNA methyltransferase [Balneolaceae bacterium]
MKKVRQSINKAWLKVKPNRSDIDCFKRNLIQLIDRINENESEEHHKKLVSDFLEETYYRGKHYINTKGRSDQVIHNGKEPESNVGVIIEAKKPTNQSEMLSKSNINTKAFQELLLYYLRDRITHKNLGIKHLIATNMYEWFVFDANTFEKAFAKNKKLLKQFEEFEADRLSGTTTDFFYKEIAQPFIEEVKDTIEYTWFDIRTYDKPLRNNNKKDDAKLIALYKFFSPEHLLKLPFANDSNSLDNRFYKELLHLIGLEEVKDGGKKVIQRPKKEDRNSGSLLENTIDHLESRDKLSRLSNSASFGSTKEERLFNVGLELCITWVNRILFLKLLEAQLISYHKGNAEFSFLNMKFIKDYDELDTLFFEVLAVKVEQRDRERLKRFLHVPYLNSSLFEPTDLEHDTLFISNLADNRSLPIISGTVLKGEKGKKRTGELSALEYLFAFLDAYDFSSEGGEDIQEDNKTLINASVLGLIFEKINGYKDGSFFTPGFITMYMCRETIRRAVVQKFNEVKGWKCSNFSELKEDLADYIHENDRIKARQEANAIINSLKICDPAVGSGHFLVSALNELLSVKADLKILVDREGERLSSYEITIENDELIVTDLDNVLFEYHPESKESQRVQETLFHEKQTLIENCLFGVDINPNSVKICRLRLWIELLKHAYYHSHSEPDSSGEESAQADNKQNSSTRVLETLPNIDINIKTGNSLISRFALDADLKDALKKSKWSIESYRAAVQSYRTARNKDEKREMLRLMEDIKGDFRTEIQRNDPKVVKLKKLSDELVVHTTQTSMFDQTAKEKKAWQKTTEKLTQAIAKLETEIEEIKNNKIFENAFEWRFEFPEVLNEQGDFVGFDVVIGNPPYIRQEEFKEIKPYLQTHYASYAGTADIYVYFVERGFQNMKQGGQFTYIIPNKWMRAGYGKSLRNYLKEQKLNTILDFGDLPVFEEATTYPCILGAEKTNPSNRFEALNVESLDFPEGLNRFVEQHKMDMLADELPDHGWTLTSAKEQRLIAKLKNKGTSLGEYVDGKIFYGIKTGYNKAFVIDEETKDQLIAEDTGCTDIIKPFLAGKEIKRYQQPEANNYLILFKNGDTKNWFGELKEDEAWEKLCDKYPSITTYLIQFVEPAKKRYDQGEYWWELRACAYYDEFEKPKIMLPDISIRCEALMDNEDGFYCANTAYIIPGLSLNDLGQLNSKLILFFYSNLTQTIRGGYFRFIRQYLEQIPFIKTDKIESKVTEILSLKKENPQADTSKLEAEIDQMVYELYGLSEEEIAIVESSFE